jgi:CRISPR-associated endonuclease/helicase Cas3
MKYWAHSDRFGLPPDHPGSKWQPLAEHLANVSVLSRQLAEYALPSDKQFQDLASCCGLLHDLGKYSDCFQKMILTGQGRCQHAVHGASVAYFNIFNEDTGPRPTHLALAIAGHHSGLPDMVGGGSSLQSRIKRYQQEATGLIARATQDSEPLREFLQQPFPSGDRIATARFDLFTRMLFSCLVDADRLDSAGRTISQLPLNAADRLCTLMTRVRRLAATSDDSVVKSARQEVLKDCLAAARCPERLLSLTVPTGGGKTLAAMALALNRAALQPDAYRRIIVVIPYLSIIEQNAEVYADVFGQDAILEHHSGSFDRLAQKDGHFAPFPDDKIEENYQATARRSETENWDSPLIVTTSVRFFESLFSNRPADLRRVHNIARSIVILDEVQTLPRRLLTPLLAMIRELSNDWGCTFVFSTATQPAFQRQAGGPRDARWEPGTMREIVEQPDAIRASLKRVQIEWEVDKPIGWQELAGRILSETQALTIVNLRDHASTLFDEVVSQAGERGIDPSGLFHLSTRMCAAHRLEVLECIRQRLSERLACLVVSTQLVEAGVDVDVPAVFRAVGPLDAIFQAAGRADREGSLTAALGRPGGRVVVFLPEDDRVPPNEYKEATDLTRALARNALLQGTSLQVDSAEAIQHYFERYYGDGVDLGDNLQTMRTRAEFATLADGFEMISTRTRDVFVPYGEQTRKWLEELRSVGLLTGELRRKLQRYVVGLQPYEFDRAHGVLTEIRPGSEIWIAVEGAYSETKGLKFELKAEDLVVG